MDSSGLKTALLKEDEIGRVILTHIYIENVINRYLEAALVAPEYLKKLRPSYSQKINLALCLGFPKELEKPLMFLGEIRNSFAHKIDQKIEIHLINRFYEQFSESQKNEIMSTLNESDVSWVKE